MWPQSLASTLHQPVVPVKRLRVLGLGSQEHVEPSTGFLQTDQVLSLTLEDEDAFAASGELRVG
jgi:hypothetical protein